MTGGWLTGDVEYLGFRYLLPFGVRLHMGPRVGVPSRVTCLGHALLSSSRLVFWECLRPGAS